MEKNKVSINPWKVVAIIFIILFILETLLIIWAYNYANDIIEQENNCAYNICENYESYSFDEYEGMCYCYLNGEAVKSVYVGVS